MSFYFPNIRRFSLLARGSCCAAWLLLALLGSTCLAETPTETNDVKVALVDENGKETSIYSLPPMADAVKDILFRTQVASSIPYNLWTLEISNPSLKQTYRLALEGKAPSVVHWDGNFTTGGALRANQTYYMRLIVVTPDKRIYSSKWAVFKTQQGTGTEFVLVERKKLGFYAFPTGGLYYSDLRTKGPDSTHFPTMHASLRLGLGENNSVGFIIETSPNVLTNVAVTPNGFFYSHISVFYLRRLWGALPHPPVVPQTPEYAKGTGPAPEIPAHAYGAKSNLEWGFRVFNNVLRGFGDQNIDTYLSRESAGVLLTAIGDRRWNAFRLHGAVEAGYSVFRGSLFVLHAKAGITYDRFEHLSPGIECKYQLMVGDAADDAFDGVPSGGPQGVLNQMFLLGMFFQFKI